LSILLHRFTPSAVTGGSLPLSLATRLYPAGHGLRSNGWVPEGEAGWPAGVGFDPRGRDFKGMQRVHNGTKRQIKGLVFCFGLVVTHRIKTDQHGVQLTFF